MSGKLALLAGWVAGFAVMAVLDYWQLKNSVIGQAENLCREAAQL